MSWARETVKWAVKEVLLWPILRLRHNRAGGRVYLSFDDGPCQDSARVLDVLAAHGAKATFFLVGEEVERHPELVRRMVDEGHRLGLHCTTHKSLVGLSLAQVAEEIAGVAHRVAEVAGEASKLCRPPFGRLTIPLLFHALRAGIKIILWSSDPEDIRAENESEVVDFFNRNPIRAGDIVLLHDTSRPTVDALDAILRGLSEAGLTPVALDL